MRLIDADAFIADARMAGLDTAEKVLFALSHQPTIEPNLILPERMERGECYEVGETIVVMNHDDCYDLLCRAMENEPKQGEWIDKGVDYDGTWYYQCSECSASVENVKYPHCPYCLARMKGADDENR